MVEGLRSMLQDRFEIIGVGYSGDELLELLRSSQPDGLLLDLSLPGRSGLELLPDITVLQPRLRILVVTMHVDRVLANAAIRAGAHGFIPKDSGIDELQVAINEVLAGRQYLSPRIPKQSHRVALGAKHLGLSRLTERQQEIVRLIGDGKTTTEISEMLGVSENTVTFHRVNIRKVLGISSEWGLVRYAIMVQIDTEETD